MRTDVPDEPRLSRAFWIASLLFFLSGATGLAYEVIWFKRFSHLWGNSTLAMAAVVASFLFGLGLGARLLGAFADRVASPLWWYGVFEAGIAGLGILIPIELHLVAPLAATLHEPLGNQPVLYSLSRFVVTFAVIGPPCVLMGATLPMLVRQFTPPGTELKRATAWLYGVNTLGAATGCYLTGFHLLPTFGLQLTNAGTAALNLAIAAVALIVGRALVPGADVAHVPAVPCTAAGLATEAVPEGIAYPRAAVLWTALATGTAALVLQVIWNRQLALILGGTTYAFTAMLFVILVGIGLGSLIHHGLLRESRHLPDLPAAVILLTMATTVLGQWAIPKLTALVGLALPLRSSDAFEGVLGVAASAAIQLLPALGMGVLFPLLVQLMRRGSDRAGSAVGTIYAWNTLGTIAGATLTSLLFIPALGTARTVTLALGLYAIAALVLVPEGGRGRATRRALVSGLAVIVLALSATLWNVDPRTTNWGMFMYGYQPPATLAQLEPLFFREGASCNVLVVRGTRDGSHNLRVNGKVDASDQLDMVTQLGSAYVVRFLRPEARDVLVIGFGSGTTAGASLQFPDTHVTCTEIEPAVFEASRYFAHVNHSPEASPRFSMVFDDGRSHLQGTSATYDLIISEPSNPWIAGISNLFTREFYEAANARLKPDGVLAQWIQTYNLTPTTYAMIVKTMRSVFPHVGLVRLGKPDTVLLASMSPLEPTAATVAAAQQLVDENPVVRDDLARWLNTTKVRDLLMTLYVLDEAALDRLVEKHEPDVLNTDGNMRLEFEAAQAQWAEDPKLEDTVYWHVMASTSPEWFAESFVSMGRPPEEAGIFHALALDLTEIGLGEQAARLVEKGLELDPANPKLLADQLVLAPPSDPEAIAEAMTRILAESEVHASDVAAALGRRGRLDLSADLYRRILDQHPDSQTVLKNLAAVYRAQERQDLAGEMLGRALALDPLDRALLAEQAAAQGRSAVSTPGAAQAAVASRSAQGVTLPAQ